MIDLPAVEGSGKAESGLILRHDLVGVLDRAIQEQRVTIVSAPAGSGKTSLLSAWASRPGRTTGSRS